MAIGNFSACDAFTAQEEGGLSMDPNDSGNWTGGHINVGELLGTNYGIAAADHPGINPSTLTAAQAAQIRHTGYWLPVQGEVLPVGVDLMVYDEAVNAGVGRSAKILQGCVGVTQDGAIGKNTLNAVRAMTPVALITALAGAQAAYYRALDDFPTYGAEWLGRVSRRQSAALRMIAPQAGQGSP